LIPITIQRRCRKNDSPTGTFLACTTVLVPILIVLLLSRGSSALLLAFDPNENTYHEEQHGGDRQADEDGNGRAMGELPFCDGYLWGGGVGVVRLVLVGITGTADHDGHAAGMGNGSRFAVGIQVMRGESIGSVCERIGRARESQGRGFFFFYVG